MDEFAGYVQAYAGTIDGVSVYLPVAAAPQLTLDAQLDFEEQMTTLAARQLSLCTCGGDRWELQPDEPSTRFGIHTFRSATPVVVCLGCDLPHSWPRVTDAPLSG